jgi:hypothetical protein
MARFDERTLNGMGVFAAIAQARSFAAAGVSAQCQPRCGASGGAARDHLNFVRQPLISAAR